MKIRFSYTQTKTCHFFVEIVGRLNQAKGFRLMVMAKSTRPKLKMEPEQKMCMENKHHFSGSISKIRFSTRKIHQLYQAIWSKPGPGGGTLKCTEMGSNVLNHEEQKKHSAMGKSKNGTYIRLGINRALCMVSILQHKFMAEMPSPNKTSIHDGLENIKVKGWDGDFHFDISHVLPTTAPLFDYQFWVADWNTAGNGPFS